MTDSNRQAAVPESVDQQRRRFLKSTTAGTAAAVVTHGMGLSAAEPKPLPRRKLGNTGIEVPILGLGTAPAGHRPRKEATAFFEQCLDAGINYIDTAPEFAGYGEAQKALGDLLKRRRKDVFLVTKCWKADGEQALKLLKANLKELQTDYADLVYAHSIGSDQMDPQTVMGKRGVMRALLKAKRDGLIRFIGISGHNRPPRYLPVIREYEVQVMMNAVNYVARHIYGFETKVWPEAHRRGVALVAMKVYGGGVKPSGGKIPRAKTRAAFRYALSLPHVSTAVIGMYNRRELEENLRYAREYTPLSPDERQALLAEGKQLATKWKLPYGPVS